MGPNLEPLRRPGRQAPPEVVGRRKAGLQLEDGLQVRSPSSYLSSSQTCPASSRSAPNAIKLATATCVLCAWNQDASWTRLPAERHATRFPSWSACSASRRCAWQARLDPIDWATYEPYLWANEAATYGRCAVLLGSLMQLERLHQTVRKI